MQEQQRPGRSLHRKQLPEPIELQVVNAALCLLKTTAVQTNNSQSINFMHRIGRMRSSRNPVAVKQLTYRPGRIMVSWDRDDRASKLLLGLFKDLRGLAMNVISPVGDISSEYHCIREKILGGAQRLGQVHPRIDVRVKQSPASSQVGIAQMNDI